MAVATIKKTTPRRKTHTNLRKKRTELIKMTQGKRYQELQSFVKICFLKLKEEDVQDFKEVCNKSGLSLTTIYRLSGGDFTGCVRFNTIQSLGIAAGLQLHMDEYKAKVVLIK